MRKRSKKKIEQSRVIWFIENEINGDIWDAGCKSWIDRDMARDRCCYFEDCESAQREFHAANLIKRVGAEINQYRVAWEI